MSNTKNNNHTFEAVRFWTSPTKEQDALLGSWIEELRWLYNHALAERNVAWEQHKQTIRYRQQRDALPALKKQRPSLQSLPAQAVQDCLERLQHSFDNFFRRCKERKEGHSIKPGYPRFKKFGRYQSLTYTQVWRRQTSDPKKPEYFEVCSLRFDPSDNPPTAEQKFAAVNAILYLPKLGELKIRVHRECDWKRAKRITLKKSASGRWYACICFETAEASPASHQGKEGGFDLGLKKLLATSDGQYFEHPHFLRKSEHKLKKEQRKLSKKRMWTEEVQGKKLKKRSKNWEKQRKKVAKCHEKIKNQRFDFLHKLSLWLVLTYSVIVFEKLNILGLVKNHQLAKSILDAGWGTLVTFVTYKSVKPGAKVYQVDPRYTTQDCSRCGHRVPKTLAERLHKCPRCGLVMCRDQNAAINILHKVGLGQSEPADDDDSIGQRLGERVPLAVKNSS